jgi:hypothetical protein
LGANFRISTQGATGDERDPAIAYNSVDDEYLVVWEDDRNQGGTLDRGWDIYGRRVDADGTRIGGDFRISGGQATDDEYDPAVAYNPAANQYLVVWGDGRQYSSRGWDIYGQRVRANGTLAGSNIRISGVDATGDDEKPAVAFNSASKQFLVVWEDERLFTVRGSDIYAQRLRANGVRAGSNIRISGGGAAPGSERTPAVMYASASNQYLVVWYDYRKAPTRGTDIYGQRVYANGVKAGHNIRISGAGATGNERYPAAAYNPVLDQFLVVWGDSRLPPGNLDIYGQRMDADGTTSGHNFRISGAAASGNEFFPAVTYNSVGDRYLVVWQDPRSNVGWDIYGQAVQVYGALSGLNTRISGASATGDDQNPAMAFNPTTAQYLVVWDDGRNQWTRGLDVYGQRLSG